MIHVYMYVRYVCEYVFVYYICIFQMFDAVCHLFIGDLALIGSMAAFC